MPNPIMHETTTFDIRDLTVWRMLTDVASASPTYGPPIDIPGAAEANVTPDMITALLRGDAQLIARKSRIDGFTMAVTYGLASLDVFKTIMGGDLDDSITGEAHWSLATPAPSPLFGARFVIDDVDLGLDAMVVTLYKCVLTGGTLLHPQSENFGQPAFDVSAYQVKHMVNPPASLGGTGVKYVDYTPLIDVGLFESFPFTRYKLLP